jgi:hypothetical protein
MPKAIRAVLILASLLVAIGCLAACGGGAPADVVAQVGPTSITKTQVNHWMSTLAGGDFYEVSHHHTIPVGLVSEPPSLAACITRLQAAAPTAGKGAPRLSAAQLGGKCRQLNQAMKLQAVGFLVESQWIIALAADEGVKASDQEVKQLFSRIRAEYPTQAAFQQFLGRNRRSLADELFVVKLDVLREKLSKKLTAGGKPMLAKLTDDGQRWTEKTSCRAGYVVAHCKQFKQELPHTSPAVLLEQVAAITGLPCVNLPACAPG